MVKKSRYKKETKYEEIQMIQTNALSFVYVIHRLE